MIRRLIRLELNIWRSLLFWIVRHRPGTKPGAQTFPYARELAPLIGVFIFVSTIELVAVHLLLPWETVRLVLDIISVWGLLWMVGLLAATKVYPHVLDDTLHDATLVGSAEVTQVQFYVNDAKAFVAASREHLAAVGS